MPDDNPNEEPRLMDPVKRLRYYTGQFLAKADFLSEQQYHLAMRRRANLAAYLGAGIIDNGFQLTTSTNNRNEIQVSRGLGIDGEGRELVLVEPQRGALPSGAAGMHYVTLSYHAEPADRQVAAGGSNDYTRYTETPQLGYHLNLGDFDNQVEIVIGRIQVDTQGNAVGAPDLSVRQMAKARAPGDLTVGQGGNGVLRVRHIDGKDFRSDGADDLFLNWSTGRNVSIGFGGANPSSLFVSGRLGVGTTRPVAALDVRGPNAPTGAAGQRDVSLSFESAGSVRLRAFRGDFWDTSLQLLTNARARGSDDPEVRVHIEPDGKVGIGTVAPKASLHVQGTAAVSAGAGSWAVSNQYMASGSLTIGSIDQDYGGGWQWNANTAGLLLETRKDTEIAVHDAGTRIASLASYEGDAANRITIGRDMGWGEISEVSLRGDVTVGGTAAARCPLRIPEKGLQIGVDAADATKNFHLVADDTGGRRGLRVWNRNWGAGTHLMTILVDGKVGIGTTTPGQLLDVAGDMVANGYRSRNSLQLLDYKTVNPSSNVCLKSSGNDRDSWVFRDDADGASNWGIYHRQVDSVVNGLPGNSIAFVGGGTSELQAYVNLGDGSAYHRGKVGIGAAPSNVALNVGGDVSAQTASLSRLDIAGKQAMVGDADRLRINEGDAFPRGVRIGGPLLAVSLNVGGVDNAADPGGGNIRIAGTMATSGRSVTPRSGLSGGLHTFDIEAYGSIWCANSVHSVTGNFTRGDLAEKFRSDQALEPGDVVRIDPERDGIQRTDQPYDRLVCGVVSTAPGLVLNSPHDVQPTEGPPMFPLALAGRVPCKVVDENGPIARGNLLTSSSVPGHAMRWRPMMTGGDHERESGAILGKALGRLASGSGVIDVLVCLK